MPGKPLIYQDDTIVASPAAAAETVVCKLKGVASRFGNAVKLSGWVNVTPDTDATAIVLRVRRGTTTGGTLVTPAETIGFGAGAGGGAVLGDFQGQVNGDTSGSAAMDGAPHSTSLIVAAPPAWMDNAGHIIAAGQYEVTAGISVTTLPTAPGLFAAVAMPFTVTDFLPVDPMGAIFGASLSDVMSLGAADLPYLVAVGVTGETDVTGVLGVALSINRLASDVAASGGVITPGDAVLDVIDLPGQIAQASYVLTAQMTGANSPSVINGVSLTARID